MTNKITMSRELAELCYRALNGGDNQLTGMEHGRAFRELRAALADPVPPADGEPEVLERPKEIPNDDHLRARITFLTKELHRLLDEVERLKNTRQKLAGAVHSFMAELTKVRELLTKHQFEYLLHSRRGKKGAGYYCVQCGERKDNGCATSCELEVIISNQSAPVAVVMPERMRIPSENAPAYVYRKGWNACLDEVTRLNEIKS